MGSPRQPGVMQSTAGQKPVNSRSGLDRIAVRGPRGLDHVMRRVGGDRSREPRRPAIGRVADAHPTAVDMLIGAVVSIRRYVRDCSSTSPPMFAGCVAYRGRFRSSAFPILSSITAANHGLGKAHISCTSLYPVDGC